MNYFFKELTSDLKVIRKYVVIVLGIIITISIMCFIVIGVMELVKSYPTTMLVISLSLIAMTPIMTYLVNVSNRAKVKEKIAIDKVNDLLKPNPTMDDPFGEGLLSRGGNSKPSVSNITGSVQSRAHNLVTNGYITNAGAATSANNTAITKVPKLGMDVLAAMTTKEFEAYMKARGIT